MSTAQTAQEAEAILLDATLSLWDAVRHLVSIAKTEGRSLASVVRDCEGRDQQLIFLAWAMADDD